MSLMRKKMYDKIIIGAGIYGLYAALYCGGRGEEVLVLEKEAAAFQRATYVNQARVHLGYHYPRSLSTARSTARYFDRFVRDFPECIKSDFDQIYATSRTFSWTQAEPFLRFSKAAGIPCEKVPEDRYFKEGMVDGAFLTGEATFDAELLCGILLARISAYPNVTICYRKGVTKIERQANSFRIFSGEESFESGYVLNATYAGVNEICLMAGFSPFEIKYELCEVILGYANDALKNLGITVMDGPFFSIMPFGKTGMHSLTSVTFTPHKTSFSKTPVFDCQERSNGACSALSLANCALCPHRPESALSYMLQLAKKYLREEFSFTYETSLYSMKPILLASDVDDSRPTSIRVHSEDPYFVSVLSGKITTVYDLEEIL